MAPPEIKAVFIKISINKRWSVKSIQPIVSKQKQSEYKIILHMKLEDIISQSIHENGKPIGFDVFMNFALYSPRLGYYRSSCAIYLVSQGDFITAPETSNSVWLFSCQSSVPKSLMVVMY